MSNVLTETPSLGTVQRRAVVPVDDNKVVQTRVAQALECAGFFVRVATLPSFLKSVDVEEVVVLHRCRLGDDDLALLRELKREHGELRTVVVFTETNLRDARRAIDIGINGMVFASQIETALPATVAAVLAGQTVVPSELTASLRRQTLSFREKQVLGLAVLGLTNSQIGARLYVAESTVKTHLSSSFAKLGVASRSEAAALVLDPHEPVGVGIMRLAQEAAESSV